MVIGKEGGESTVRVLVEALGTLREGAEGRGGERSKGTRIVMLFGLGQ